MNINKFLFYFFILFNISVISVLADNHDKEVNLDDEELPAIDPFQSSSGISSPGGSSPSTMQLGSSGSGLLGGLRLVGTIVGETDSIAILSSTGGSRKFSENSYINDLVENKIGNLYLISNRNYDWASNGNKNTYVENQNIFISGVTQDNEQLIEWQISKI